LNLLFRTSLSIKARIIGIGNENRNFKVAIRTVFLTTFQNSESFSHQKLAHKGLDHGEPKIPPLIVKFLAERMRPYIGM